MFPLFTDVMKLAETKYSVVTQHICAATAQKAMSNRGSEMTLDNLVMKTNLKLGGVNHALGTPVEFLRQNRTNSRVVYAAFLPVISFHANSELLQLAHLP